MEIKDLCLLSEDEKVIAGEMSAKIRILSEVVIYDGKINTATWS